MAIDWPHGVFPFDVVGYSVAGGLGVDSYTGYGGLPRQIVSRDGDTVRLTVSIQVHECDMPVWLDFFQISIRNGSDTVNIDVDLGTGIETLEAAIVPDSIRQTVNVFGSTISLEFVGISATETSGIDDAIFPPELLISLPYSLQYGGSNITDLEESGIPLITQDLKYESIPISVTLQNINRSRLAIWTNFYRTAIDRGAYAFIMPIDTGAGIRDHVVTIAGDGVQITTESAISWSVRIKATAERLQDIDTYCGKLADLANCAGQGQLVPTIHQLDTLVNTDFSNTLDINDYGALPSA